jgi:hypothetical protein
MWTLLMRRLVALFGGIALAAVGLVVGMPAPAGATRVSDEATFRAAWTNPAETSIVLVRDIALTCAGGGIAARGSPTPLILEGRSHTITQACADNGVLAQGGVGKVTLRNVTITGGRDTGTGGPTTGMGGAVHAVGELEVKNGRITNNTASVLGGGVFGQGAVTLTNSIVSNNTSNKAGGGLWVMGVLKVTNSTISGNTAEDLVGGGGIATAASATIINSTITGNTAGVNGGAGGGGITSTGSTTIINSTITRNTDLSGFGGGGIAMGISGQVNLVYTTVVENTASPSGGNVESVGGRLVSFGSVVALPQGAGNCAGPPTISHGYNFSDGGCGFTASTDRDHGGNPGLSALANNGGPTQTRLPKPSSRLLNRVKVKHCQDDGASGITTDQRGLGRPHGNGCDIGAVERQ